MAGSSDSDRFAGRVVVVTGAASGLGRATAQVVADEGGHVAALDISKDSLERAVDEITAAGGRAVAFPSDVSDPESVAATMKEIVAELGPPRAVCNVAGIGKFAHTVDAQFEDWQRIIAVNLTGTFLMCQAALPHLLENGGNIVNVASTAGVMGQPYSAAYCASKGGVVLLTKALAIEYVERGVRVNAVAPGGVDTPMINSFEIPEGASKRLMATLTTPMGFVKPEQVAKVIAFLASDDGDYMTGAIVSVDGGLTI
jgi:NAD(P)-dependent dehydrogenase (short-subunit alcohol dehydrogenase family)